MKAVRRFCAVLIGLVFLLAGILKLMDPVGAGLVVGEYFNFLHLGFLAPAARFTGVGMALLETLLGAALITGVWPRGTAICTGVVLAAFTVLTFVMWLVNPSMDCGCFGEAVHLTHLQSFLKNLVLCALWCGAFLPFRSIVKPRKLKYVSFGIAALSVAAFTIYSLVSIPPMDFTPFKPGATLMQAMKGSSEDSPLLSFCDAVGEYCDDMLSEGSWLVISAYEPDDLPAGAVQQLSELEEEYAALDSVNTVFISAGEAPLAPFGFTADRRTLMTLNRSNGGATLVSDGYIVAKWPLRSIPSAASVEAILSEPPTDAMMHENTPKRLKLQGFLLYVFAVILLL